MPRRRKPMPAVCKNGNGFRARYTSPDGKRRWTTTRDTPDEVQFDLARLATDIADGAWRAPEGARITLDQWFDVWMPTRGVAESTRYGEWSTYRNHISPFLGTKRLSELANSTLIIQQWLSWMDKQGTSDAMKKRSHTLLKTALGKQGAMGDGRIKNNPCWAISPVAPSKKQWKLLTKEQFDRIHDALPSLRDRCVLLAAAYAGLRWSEIVGMRRRDYNPLRKELTVNEPVTRQPGGTSRGRPKSKKTRTIPVYSRLGDALNAHLAANPEIGPDDPIFPGQRAATLGYTWFRLQVWLPTLFAVGYTKEDHPRFHDLRHSCASWLVGGGMNLAEVKEIMGHASVTTTELYIHTDPDEKHQSLTRAFGG